MSFLLISVTPEPCMDRCQCSYDQQHKANIFDCSANNIDSLPDRIQNQTDWLILRGSNITNLCDFPHYMQTMKHLDMRKSAHNSKICANFFDNIKSKGNPKSLNLSQNRLRSLPKNVEESGVKELWIGGNPYQCDCHMIWMRDWLLGLSTSSSAQTVVPDYKQAICASGLIKTKGKPIYLLDEGAMGCNDLHPYVIVLISFAIIIVIPMLLFMLIRYYDALRFLLFLKFNILIGKDDDEDKLGEMDFDMFISYR